MNRMESHRRSPVTASMVASWLTILLGVWIVSSPFVLGFSRDPTELWSNIAVGVAIALIAAGNEWGKWSFLPLIVPIAAWLFVSPFLLGFSQPAFLWNNVLSAFAVIAVAAASEELHFIDFH